MERNDHPAPVQQIGCHAACEIRSGLQAEHRFVGLIGSEVPSHRAGMLSVSQMVVHFVWRDAPAQRVLDA